MSARPLLIPIATLTLVLASAGSARAQLWPQQPAAQPAPAPGQYQPPAPVTNPWGGMQAGGLTPPPPLPNGVPSGSGQTARQLDQSKRDDSGRKLEWVWFEAEGGFEHVGIETFNPEGTLTSGFVSSSVNGGMAGAGLGAKLLFFTLGARGRASFFSAFQRFSVGPELGIRLPIGKLDPHLQLGAGYTALGRVHDLAGGTGVIGARGYYVRVSGGLDYYLLRFLSLGLGVSWELLGLGRDALTPEAIDAIKVNQSLSPAQLAKADQLGVKASSLGSALAVSGIVGVHF